MLRLLLLAATSAIHTVAAATVTAEFFGLDDLGRVLFFKPCRLRLRI